MTRASRITTATVLCAVSVVLCLLGAALAMRSGVGLTAHLFLPQSKLKQRPILAPLGPSTIDGLRQGLRVSVLRHGWSSESGYSVFETGVTEIEPQWPNPFEAQWRGYLAIAEPGLYRFRIRGTQNVSFALDGRTLGGVHAPWHGRDNILTDVVSIRLAPGLHTLAIEQRALYRVRPRALLSVEWAQGDWAWQPIPAESLWSAATDSGWTRQPPDPHLPPDAPEGEWLAQRHLTGLPMARPSFAANHAFYAAFADRWDFARFHLMNHFPGFEVLWRGRLRVTEKRVHRLVAVTEGAIQIRLGNSSAEAAAGAGEVTWSGDLEPGWHDLSVSFVSPWPTESLRLAWDGEGVELRPISASRLRPVAADDAWFAPRRRLSWAIFGLGTVGVLIGLLGLRRERSLKAGELRAGLRRGGYALALCLIMLLGLGLRLHRYNEIPSLLISSDEHHNARKGWHLLHGEGLRAWTPVRFLDLYEPEQIDRVQWADLRLDRVRPNFDRPPLFPLLLGVFDATLGRAETFWEVGPGRFRLFPIFLSVLSLPLVAALTRRVYGGRGAALLAALLFAAVPSIVLNHRQAKSDVLLVVFVLVGLLAAFRHLDTGKRRWMWAAAVAAGLAAWSKEVGVVAVAIIPYVWLRQKRWREGLTVATIAAAILGLYFVWGSWVDFDVFWGIVRAQASQASSFDAAWRFLTEAKLVQVSLPFAVGWTLWLWLAVAYVAPRDELPAVAAVCFLLVISSVVRVEWIFGWYWVPMFPFLCVAGGVYLYDLVRRPDIVRGGLFVLTAIFMTIHAQRGGEVEEIAVTRGAVGIILLPFAVATFFPQRRIVQAARVWAALIILGALILGGVQLASYE